MVWGQGGHNPHPRGAHRLAEADEKHDYTGHPEEKLGERGAHLRATNPL